MTNPYQAGADLPTQTTKEPWEKVVKIAQYQRYCLGCVMLTIVAHLSFYFSELLPPGYRLVVSVFAGICYVLVALLTVVVTVILAREVFGVVGGTLIGLLVIVPFLNLLIFLVVISQASRKLEAEGVRIGLFGAKPETVKRSQ